MSRVTSRRCGSLALVVGMALAACAGSAGCVGRTAPPVEVDEHGHAAPAHKPATFAKGVAQVERRYLQAAEGPKASEQTAVRDQELADVIDWLPELAADTDLDEAAWNDVQRSSRELAALWERRHALPGNAPDRADDRTWQSLVQRLQQLAALTEDLVVAENTEPSPTVEENP